MESKIREIENFHILLWLLKDMCWVFELKVLGLIMITPAISVAIWITWINRKFRSELFHNLAVVSWIIANSVWMIGEFFFNDTTRNIAIIFFLSGLLFVSYYYITLLRQKLRSKTQINE